MKFWLSHSDSLGLAELVGKEGGPGAGGGGGGANVGGGDGGWDSMA